MKKKKNDVRCPLQPECAQKCKYVGCELDCEYYSTRAREGYLLEDQEQERENRWLALEKKLFLPKGSGGLTQHANSGRLVHVPVHLLYPHPKNPRKDLGDLTELAESIKVNGILQNLTIVPGHYLTDEEWSALTARYAYAPTEEIRTLLDSRKSEAGFTIIIGHRRSAASRLAGLTELPCAIVNMSEFEQVQTMLQENMQRSDLTTYEQAQGFQMMLDLGSSEEEIAEKAGFSKATVRHRVKLLELDPVKFQESEARGGTLSDYIALEKIQDPDLKNQVLDAIGTNNFSYELNRAKEKEQTEKRRATALAAVSKWAGCLGEGSPSTHPENMKRLRYIWYSSKIKPEDIACPEEPKDAQYYYQDNVSFLCIYVVADQTEEERQEQEAYARKQAITEELHVLARNLFHLRRDFIANLSVGKQNADMVMSFAAISLMEPWSTFNYSSFCKIMTIKEKGDKVNYETVTNAFAEHPARCLLAAAYSKFGDSEKNSYHDWSCAYKKSERLDRLYGCLKALGYEESDEERAYRTGEHSLFQEVMSIG